MMNVIFNVYNINVFTIIIFVILAKHVIYSTDIPLSLGLSVKVAGILIYPFDLMDTVCKSYIATGPCKIIMIRDELGDIAWRTMGGSFVKNVNYCKDNCGHMTLTMRVYMNGNVENVKLRRVDDITPWYHVDDPFMDGIETHILLDLMDLNDDDNVVYNTEFGNKIISITLSEDSKVVWIECNGTPIWELLPEVDGRLIRARAIKRRDVMKLLKIDVLYDDRLEVCYFKRELDHSWNQCLNDEFEALENIIRNESSLDITYINNVLQNDNYHVMNDIDEVMTILIIRSKNDIYTTEIIDHNNVVWISRNNMEYILDVRCYYKDGKPRLVILRIIHYGVVSTIYLWKYANYTWVEVDEHNFNNTLIKIKNEYIFDISNVDNNINVQRYINHVDTIKYIFEPLPHVTIINVIDGIQCLWKNNNTTDYLFLGCILYIRYNNKLLLHIMGRNRNNISIYYKWIIDMWVRIPEYMFKNILINVENEFILDINFKYFNHLVIINDSPVNNHNACTYYIKEDTFLSSIKDHNQIIWRSGDIDIINQPKCSNVIIYYNHDTPKLLHIFIQINQQNSNNIYFIKQDDGNWIMIDEEEFKYELMILQPYVE